jgi:hypothetical protein
MSTKIYDAFRVLKEKDIKGLITEMRSIASDTVANSADYLYQIHAIASADAAKKKDADKAAMAAYEDVIKNHFGIFIEMWMLNMVKKAETSIEKDILDCSLKAVCTFDDEFWYIKFFSNSGISRKILNNILEKLELEDFHYQNQSDPPEEISQEEYDKRGEKWDQLLPDYLAFNSFPFEINIFDSNRLERLIFDFNYNKKELAYKFDKKYEKVIQK